MRSAVVYKFSCPECGAQYVGSTTRSLAARTAEHAGVNLLNPIFETTFFPAMALKLI